MTTSLAPIALFVYNRLDHTKQTIEALKKNLLATESELFIFSDGPKNDGGKEKIQAVRNYLKTVQGFAKISIIERENNLGLANSVILGVTEIINKFSKIIVLEDDLVTSPYFLKFMNDGLNLYQNEEKVASIHGYIYPVEGTLPETFFLKGADCWGWATWARAWRIFEPDGRILLEKLKEQKLEKEFDFDGSYPYTLMLKSQIAGKNDSWAVRWHASAFLLNMFTLYPGHSLVQNIGMDMSGTHCADEDDFNVSLSTKQIRPEKIPVEENLIAKKTISEYFAKQNRVGYYNRFRFFLKRIFNKNA